MNNSCKEKSLNIQSQIRKTKKGIQNIVVLPDFAHMALIMHCTKTRARV
jgi:hypothetical protein